MRLYFATDIHGSDKCWRKLLQVPAYYDVDVVVVGGDITGKFFVPIVVDSKGHGHATYRGVASRLKKAADRAAFAKRVADSGGYAFEVTPSEMSTYSASETARTELFQRLMLDRVRQWTDLAAERLDPRVAFYINCGNDDDFTLDAVLQDSTRLIFTEGSVVELAPGLEMLSVGFANPTPWSCPRDITEEALGQRIHAAARRLTEPTQAVFNLHVPPYGSGLDVAPKLADDLSIVRSSSGEPEMTFVGSTAVQSAIDLYQPRLGLHGHVHESPGIAKVGSTLAINPGSEYQDGLLAGAIVEVDGRGAAHATLVSG